MGLLYFLGSEAAKKGIRHCAWAPRYCRMDGWVYVQCGGACVFNWRRAGRSRSRSRSRADGRTTNANKQLPSSETKKRQGDGRWLHRQAGEHTVPGAHAGRGRGRGRGRVLPSPRGCRPDAAEFNARPAAGISSCHAPAALGWAPGPGEASSAPLLPRAALMHAACLPGRSRHRPMPSYARRSSPSPVPAVISRRCCGLRGRRPTRPNRQPPKATCTAQDSGQI